MERLVIKGTTRNPQTQAGHVLLLLVRSLKESRPEVFRRRLRLYKEKYQDFLNERTEHPFSGDWSYTHEGVRSAYLSLERFEEYLFTYQEQVGSSRTTNSIEGHFSHIKDILRIHRGLSKKQKEKVLRTILLASSIAPDDEEIEGIL